MYLPIYDEETGGITLTTSPSQFSSEPRPVYAPELDMLGFKQHWKYDGQTEFPYMWAEANRYWYRGKLVAETRGGNLYNAPVLVRLGDPAGDGSVGSSPMALRPIDIGGMIRKNREMLAVIEQAAVKRIYGMWRRWRKSLDAFHVAYSGGKDSAVLLDLVAKALPRDAFCVIFADTGMEFPDTYAAVELAKARCEAEGITFHIAKSRLDPQESWRLFGPPSRILRWCCSVHKVAPQVLKLREISGKSDYGGLAFVGVRSHESEARSRYDYHEIGKKTRGQHSHNSILEWTSAEIWLHIFANGLEINNAYKKGCARVGCLCCPLGGGKAFIEHSIHPKEMNVFLDFIIASNARQEMSSKDYLVNGGWNARKNGRFLSGNDHRYSETTVGGAVKIETTLSLADWREWMKTLGDVSKCEHGFMLISGGRQLLLQIRQSGNGNSVVSFPDAILKVDPVLGGRVRQVFRKAAFCVKCGTCESNCRHGNLVFNPNLSIRKCIRCGMCHEVITGCLVYNSLKIPAGDGEKMNKGINTLSNHAPKTNWIAGFFEKGVDFLTADGLGPVQKTKFKRFLSDAGLVYKNEATPLFSQIRNKGWDSEISLGVLLANLACSPQIAWYINQMDVGRVYRRGEMESALKNNFGQSDGNIASIINAWGRICETPFGAVLRFGKAGADGEFIRTPCVVTEPLVVLYSLFKFSEACGDYRQFTLGRLMDFSLQSDGISPARIFGLGRDVLRGTLEKLAANQRDFISVSFTHDLEKITLSENKDGAAVLKLLFGE